MAESTPINIQAFAPYNGGTGKRLSVTDVSTSAAIPGLSGGQQNARTRLLVSNGGIASAFVFFGPSGITANTDCLEILPGTACLFTPPVQNTTTMYIAAVTASGTTTSINVCAGEGT